MKHLINLVLFLLFFSSALHSQDNEYKFVIRKEVASTPVKNQNLTSTCWTFSGISFFESELMRMGKKEYDLSEMYIVREAYTKKAEEYLRRKGCCSFGGGGQYNDLLGICKEDGLVPDEAYTGLVNGQKYHNHDEMDAVLKGYMDGLIKSAKPTPSWFPGFNGILDAYLGSLNSGFSYEGQYYTPGTFAHELGLNIDDYIVISSFSDHPYYKEAILDVPVNLTPGSYYNLPLDDFVQVINNSLMNGYSVAWACDMRGKGFSMKYGVAVVPDKGWDDLSQDEIQKVFTSPHPEKKITQEIRQKEYNNYEITGDHGMHIIGIAEDQNGNIFYKVKNSWGPTGKYNGYIFVSQEFLKLKTTNCMINKNALPLAVAQKLGLETIQNGAIAESRSSDSKKEQAPQTEASKPSLKTTWTQ